MRLNNPPGALILIATALSSVFAGCRSIDATPLREQPAYEKTDRLLQHLRPLTATAGAGSALMAGGARVDITPPVGTPLAGYGNRLGRGSIGIHDRIYARALALKSGDLSVIIIANDVLAITDDISDSVYRKVIREIPVHNEALMVSASHTHSGPGAVAKRFWEGFATGPFDPLLFEWITDRMAEAAVRAHRAMRPARFGSGRASAPDLIRNRMIPGGPTDPAVEFLVFETLDRGLRLFLVNYSAHATVLKDDNYYISGDYPGALERQLESSDGAIALFTAGAVADQTANPPDGETGFDRAEKMGRALAGKVLEAVPKISFHERVPLAAIRATVYLPPTQVKMGAGRRLAFSIGDFFFDRSSVLQTVLIGNSLLIGVPCDLAAEIGLQIKERLRGDGIQGIVVGFANDYMGYVIPHQHYHSGAYEARMSFNGPYMDSYFTQVIDRLSRKVADASGAHENP